MNSCDGCGGNGAIKIHHVELGIENVSCPKYYEQTIYMTREIFEKIHSRKTMNTDECIELLDDLIMLITGEDL